MDLAGVLLTRFGSGAGITGIQSGGGGGDPAISVVVLSTWWVRDTDIDKVIVGFWS